MNKQPKDQETMTVFYLFEGGIEEFKVSTKPYNMNKEMRPQQDPSALETIKE